MSTTNGLKAGTVDMAGLAELLRSHCEGDWWDQVYELQPDPEWDPCECCNWHPLTQEQADEVNRVFAALRALGAPPPFTCYGHCDGQVFAEWCNRDSSRRAMLDFFCKFGRDVMLSERDRECRFYKIEESR